MDNEFFSTFLPIQKEDEEKFISYLFKNNEAIHLLSDKYLFDTTCKILYKVIYSIINDNLKVDYETICSFSKKYELDNKIIKDILENYNDFDNIEIYTIPKIKNYYVQRKITEDIDKLTNIIIDGKNQNNDYDKKKFFNEIKNIAEKITEKHYELTDENKLLTTKDLTEKYRSYLNSLESPSYIRTLGLIDVDKLINFPAAPEELTIIFGDKMGGKSLFTKCIENSLINQNICVISFNLEMSTNSNMNRLVSIRGGISIDDLKKQDKDERLKNKINNELIKIEKIPNYLYYEEPSLSLSDFDDMLYMGKKKFKQLGVLPKDEYMVVTVDLGDMIEDLSGVDPIKLKKPIDKLTKIYRAHKCHTIIVLQANENQLRNSKRFNSPNDCEYFTLTREDVFGGSAWAMRARVMLSINRPRLLKERFFPNRREEFEMEDDIMRIVVAKQNDGKLGYTDFVFSDDSFRIVPRRKI